MQLPDLNTIKDQLKSRFVGLDQVIDQFIENVRVWYETADLMERPLIINLWGLTGSGKTTLVRTFVELAGLTDRFAEVQFKMSKDSNVTATLSDEDFDENDYVVLLLDEFQNFRTLDSSGDSIDETGYDDLWLLLSDGIIDESKKMRKHLEILYLKLINAIERNNKLGDDDYEFIWGDDFSGKTLSITQAVEFKKFFRLKMDLKDILKLTQEERAKIVEDALNNPNHPVFKPMIFKKLLIIISGNLNEMYEFGHDVDTFDIDPDILHNYSKTLSIVDVKRALIDKFKPEQISRLGNVHIIFPAFSKQDYYKIIRKYLDDFFDKVKNKYSIQFSYDQSLVEYIFRNSVFPSQGVRPILSGLSSIVFSKIPIYIKNAKDKVHLSVKEHQLIDTVNGTSTQLDGVLDEIRKNISEDEKLLTAVHEAGHALLHSFLFGYFPHRISSASANKTNKGVTTGIQFLHNRENIEKYIITLYGGHVAEQIVFGNQKTSAYASHDLGILTQIAAALVRKQGLDGYQFQITAPNSMNSDLGITDIHRITNNKIRKILKKSYRQARKIIQRNKPLFIEMVEKLNAQGVLTDKEMLDIFQKHGINNVKVKEDNTVYAGDLISKWVAFKSDS